MAINNQVRREAGTDMHVANHVMREWRNLQKAMAAPVAITVPETVAQKNSAALAALWQHAQELANESLRAAQATWEAERVEMDIMRQELANAYDALEAEFNHAKAAAAAADQAHEEAARLAANELANVRVELAKEQAKAEAAVAEVRRMAESLAMAQEERDEAKQDVGTARERAAGLAGQLTALQEHAAALLTRLGPDGST